MHDATVVGVEGAHLHRFSAFLGLGRQLLRGSDEFFLLAHTEMIAIDPDAGGILHLFLQDAIDEILQVVEAIPVLADEETTLPGQNLQAGPFLAFFLLDGHLKPKLSDHGLKNLVSFGEGFHADSLEGGATRSSRVSNHYPLQRPGPCHEAHLSSRSRASFLGLLGSGPTHLA